MTVKGASQDSITADFVIVGGGTAGCLLANRLSADPHNQVILIEAGGPDRNPLVRIPAGYLWLIGNPRSDWCQKTVPQAQLGGRCLPLARGRILGGSSAINAMIYMRGHRANYDAWAREDGLGWGWDDVLPWFLRHEDCLDPALGHATGGSWPVAAQRVRWPVLDAALSGLAELGVPPIVDFNTGDNTGAGRFHVTQRGGRRVSTAHAFLHPVRRRANLRVFTGAQATRLLLDGRRATGVAVSLGGKEQQLRARAEVILATGSIGTPHLLMLSGIGAPDVLAAAGVAVHHSLPGVGRNLIDHLQVRCMFRVSGTPTLNTLARSLRGRAQIVLDYALRRRGPLSMAPSQAGAFLQSAWQIAHGGAATDLHVNLQPLSLDRFGEPMHDFPGITISVSNVQPLSRGHVALVAPDWRSAPEIAPGYLEDAADRARALESVDLARRLVASVAMQPFVPVEHLPGAVSDDTALLAALGQHASTLFHPCGTARMGSVTGAVVDAQLRVHGIGGLRIADASIIPRPLSGGLAAPVLMIAERAAAFILADSSKRQPLPVKLAPPAARSATHEPSAPTRMTWRIAIGNVAQRAVRRSRSILYGAARELPYLSTEIRPERARAAARVPEPQRPRQT